jgi:hypothetical protein
MRAFATVYVVNNVRMYVCMSIHKQVWVRTIRFISYVVSHLETGD